MILKTHFSTVTYSWKLLSNFFFPKGYLYFESGDTYKALIHSHSIVRGALMILHMFFVTCTFDFQFFESFKNFRVWYIRKSPNRHGIRLYDSLAKSKWILILFFSSLLFTFRLYLGKKNIEKLKKIRLWESDVFIRFEISWIHLCYFLIYVCVCMFKWVGAIVSKRCIWLSSKNV